MTKNTIIYTTFIVILSIISVRLYQVSKAYYNVLQESVKETNAIDSILTVIRKDKDSTVASIDSSLLRIDSLKNVIVHRADTTISYQSAINIITGK